MALLHYPGPERSIPEKLPPSVLIINYIVGFLVDCAIVLR